MDTSSITADEHSKVFNVTISGENNMKCIGSRLYQTFGKWVINTLKEETMSFSALSAQTHIMGILLLTYSLTHSLIFSYLVNQFSTTGLIARCWETQMQKKVWFLFFKSEREMGEK